MMNKSVILLILTFVAVAQESPRDILTASISPQSKLPSPSLGLEKQGTAPASASVQKKALLPKKKPIPVRKQEKLDVENIQTVSVSDVPFQAKVGECYAKVIKTQGEYKSVSEKTLVREAYKRVDIVPAKFEWVNQKVVVEEAAENLVKVPAVYKTVQEKVLLEPAKTVWKKGSSYKGMKVVSKKTTDSGQVMCLVEQPAKYDVVEKKVMISPEQIKKVMTEAKYTTIKVKKMVEPAREVVTEVPAVYKDEEKQLAVKEPKYSWSKVVCEANLTETNVTKIQLALQRKNAYKGPINGKMDETLLSAATKFASENGLPRGNQFIALEVIDALNVKL